MSRYVLVDLEMCKIPQLFKNKFQFLNREIIQIGAVLLNERYEIEDQFMTYVSPQYGQIDNEIHQLTGICRKDLINAPSVYEALVNFVSWLPLDAILVSWSENDLIQIEDEIEEKNIEIPSLDNYLDTWEDCQITFSEKMNTSKIYKLSEALRISSIDLDASEHDALVDAKNTAKLFAKMMTESTLVLSDYYITSKDEHNAVNNPFSGLLNKYCFEG